VAVKPIAMHEFLEKAGNIYEAIIVAAKRSRQIHDEMKIELTQQLETLKALNATPEPEDDSEVITANPDQLKISLEFEKRPKPTEVAINEVKEKKVQFRYKEPVDFFAKETPKEAPPEV
jgi:DNA-directed RNA polymerase subunit K/omega